MPSLGGTVAESFRRIGGTQSVNEFVAARWTASAEQSATSVLDCEERAD
jgi:hypothetical protein